MASDLEDKIIAGLERFLEKSSATRLAFICKKVVEGFEDYIASVGIADFREYMSNEGLFANDILSMGNPESRMPPKLAKLEVRGINLGKKLMEFVLKEKFGIDPAGIPKGKLENYLAETYGIYKRLSHSVLEIVGRSYEKLLGSVPEPLPDGFLFMAGPIASHSIPYVGNPNLYFSKN